MDVVPESGETVWLTLSEAAKRLNVHPTTLRRWADEGQIPFMLTPGGHRRFADSDVAQLTERRHTIRRIGPVERIWASQALEQTRREIMARRDDEWLRQHDSGARDRHRLLGQRLMSITLEYLTREEEDDALVEEARSVGREYGRSSREVGLPATDALRASMVFRDTLVRAAIQLPENVRIPPGSQLRLLNRVSDILNAVQLAIAETYDPETAE